MTRKRGLLASLFGIRPATYKAGRFLGDLNAVTKGATGISKRGLSASQLIRRSVAHSEDSDSSQRGAYELEG